MRKTSLLFFFAALCTFANAQTLQFSQVILINATVTPNNYTTMGTVPTGKVWKIENAFVMNGLTQLVTAYIALRLNGSYYISIPSLNDGTMYPMNDQAIWLPAGTSIQGYTQNEGYSSYSLTLDIIEFTVQ